MQGSKNLRRQLERGFRRCPSIQVSSSGLRGKYVQVLKVVAVSFEENSKLIEGVQFYCRVFGDVPNTCLLVYRSVQTLRFPPLSFREFQALSDEHLISLVQEYYSLYEVMQGVKVE